MPTEYVDHHKLDLDLKRYALDAERLSLERQRVQLELERAKRDRNFFQRNAAALISGLISLATVSVSATLAVVAFLQYQQTALIEKTKIETTRQVENTKLAQTAVDGKRRANHDALLYLTTHQQAVYSCQPEKQKRLIGLMSTAFLPDVMTQVIGELKKVCPDDRREVLATAERANDIRSVTTPVADTSVTLPPNILTREELVQQLTSAQRRDVSNALIQLYSQDGSSVVAALIDSLLPSDNPESYRHNLYVAFTLARIPKGWRATPAQRQQIRALTDPRLTQNAKDPTFLKWALQAEKFARVAD